MKGTPKLEGNSHSKSMTHKTPHRKQTIKKERLDVIPRDPEGLAVPIPRYSYSFLKYI